MTLGEVVGYWERVGGSGVASPRYPSASPEGQDMIEEVQEADGGSHSVLEAAAVGRIGVLFLSRLDRSVYCSPSALKAAAVGRIGV